MVLRCQASGCCCHSCCPLLLSLSLLLLLLLLLQVAELATQMYITNDKPNVAGLVLSGSADFKTELSQSDMFDPRLQAVVLGVVDVSYGELPLPGLTAAAM